MVSVLLNIVLLNKCRLGIGVSRISIEICLWYGGTYTNMARLVTLWLCVSPGITSTEELETLEEEPEEGPVLIRRADDTVFEGNYEGGQPHGYFRHLNTFGDLEFFGCFYRGTMLGEWKVLIILQPQPHLECANSAVTDRELNKMSPGEKYLLSPSIRMK